MVLQALEGLSDREAVRQLATNIAWKAATGLALTDEAFHSTVLVLWRNKLRTSEAPQRIFDAVRAVIVESKVLEGKSRRALDSTVLDDAVARQDTVTMLVTQIRRVRRVVPELVSVWVREYNLEGGRPPCDWDDPEDRDRLISELVDDANELVWAAENLELTQGQADAVALLALVAGQDVEPGDGPGRWRIARRTAADRVISTVDVEARHAHKTRSAYRDGYKAHVAAEPDTGLVTACDIGPGNTGDAAAGPDLVADSPAGTEVLGDSAYSAGEFRAPPPRPWHDPGHQTPTATPRHRGRAHPRRPHDRHRRRHRHLPRRHHRRDQPHRHRPLRRSVPDLPGPPPMHQRESRPGHRLAPQHDLLAAARTQADTDDFDTTYRRHRPMIERTIAWLVKDNHRRLRYRGTQRNRLGWSHRCAAVNLKRLLTLSLTWDNGWATT